MIFASRAVPFVFLIQEFRLIELLKAVSESQVTTFFSLIFSWCSFISLRAVSSTIWERRGSLELFEEICCCSLAPNNIKDDVLLSSLVSII
jgi:hypothetical protein